MNQTAKTASLLCVLDCLTGNRAVVTKSPFIIGSAPSCGLRIAQASCPPVLCSIEAQGSAYEVRVNPNFPALIDGAALEHVIVERGEEHTIVVNNQLFAFKHFQGHENWSKRGESAFWYVYDHDGQKWSDRFSPTQLESHLSELSEKEWSRQVVLPFGMEQFGFFPKDIRQILNLHPRKDVELTNHSPVEALIEEVNSEYGEFTCPICWFKFDRGDSMNVAVHASLRGDSMLGEDQMQRFYATRFNDRGQALDALGMTTSDLACPHCRRKLPPGFLDMPHHIFSIVGAPSSGKSYYLSVLVKMLQASLFKNFAVSFRDADPSENVILTQMKTQLFSAASPQDAALAKTELEGALYEMLPRQGRKVKLPKPFIFKISPSSSEGKGFSVVFYDNAGEHFEPTRNSSDSPGAQHIAVASGIFFLFDPLYNSDFRHRLTGVEDPQMNNHKLDQQDVILAESEVRIKSLLGLDTRDRITTPLAVMVGKCDTWQQLLGEQPLLDFIVDEKVSLANIAANSKRIRSLLLDICPEIVSNAEAISSKVRYFAVSPLGSSPVTFLDKSGAERIGPDPKLIKPRFVEAPTLWVLSQVSPEIIPSSPES